MELHLGQVMVADEQKDNFSFLFMSLTFIASIVAGDIAKQYMRGSAAVGLGACTAGLMVVARARWDLKGEWWFWVALGVGAALQLPLIVLMPWATPHLTGIGATAFAIPGFLMAMGCVFLAEKVFGPSSG